MLIKRSSLSCLPSLKLKQCLPLFYLRVIILFGEKGNPMLFISDSWFLYPQPEFSKIHPFYDIPTSFYYKNIFILMSSLSYVPLPLAFSKHFPLTFSFPSHKILSLHPNNFHRRAVSSVFLHYNLIAHSQRATISGCLLSSIIL